MKKPITILAVLLLLSTTAFAAEYPSQVSYSMNNGIFEVRKTYELPVDQEPSMQAKQSFEQDGYSFTLTDLLRQELPEQQSKEYTETVTVSSESKELTAILPLLADTKAVTTEDGFTGTLKLDTSSITESLPDTKTIRGQYPRPAPIPISAAWIWSTSPRPRPRTGGR